MGDEAGADLSEAQLRPLHLPADADRKEGSDVAQARHLDSAFAFALCGLRPQPLSLVKVRGSLLLQQHFHS